MFVFLTDLDNGSHEQGCYMKISYLNGHVPCKYRSVEHSFLLGIKKQGGKKSHLGTRLHTAWKLSKYGVFSGLHLPVSELNTGNYGPEKTPYLDTFHAVTELPI